MTVELHLTHEKQAWMPSQFVNHTVMVENYLSAVQNQTSQQGHMVASYWYAHIQKKRT